MAAAPGAAVAGGPGAAGAAGTAGAAPLGLRGWLRSAYRFATDRNDFRRWVPPAGAGRERGRGAGAGPGASAAGLSLRNLLVNLGLFAAGVWVARNLTDIDLMAPQPGP